MVAVVAGIAAASWYALVFKPWWQRKQPYIGQFTACGALPPPPTPDDLRRFKRILRKIIYVQVGAVRFEGLHHLQTPGPKLITPNHGSSADVAIALAIDEPMRAMAARAVFTFANGLGALLFGPAGAFPVDLTPGAGGPALTSAVEVLVSGQSVLMFPEGWAYMDGRVGKFKKGAVRIARQASEKRGEPVHIVPVYMRYGRYPGKWILKFPPPVQYLLAFLLFFLYRRGLTVVFGEPLSSSSLPTDDCAATAVLRAAVLAADPAAPTKK